MRRWLENQLFMWKLLRKGREALIASETRYRQLLDSNIIGVMKVDWKDRILDANDAFLNLVGYSRHDLFMGRLEGAALTPPEYNAADEWARARLRDTGVCPPIEKEYIRKDGTRVSVIVGVVFHDQPHQHLVCLVIDGSERRRALEATRKAYDELESRVQKRTEELAKANGDLQKEIERRREAESTLQKLAITDPLTGLYNRRGFETLGNQLLKQAMRSAYTVLVIVIDVDDLKSINDHYGHPEGDLALQTVGELLTKTFRTSDILSRVGGDEFMIAMREEGIGNSKRDVLRRLDEQVAGLNARARLPYALSVSVGTAELKPRQEKALEVLLALADAELYEMKRSKKLRVI